MPEQLHPNLTNDVLEQQPNLEKKDRLTWADIVNSRYDADVMRMFGGEYIVEDAVEKLTRVIDWLPENKDFKNLYNDEVVATDFFDERIDPDYAAEKAAIINNGINNSSNSLIVGVADICLHVVYSEKKGLPIDPKIQPLLDKVQRETPELYDSMKRNKEELWNLVEKQRDRELQRK